MDGAIILNADSSRIVCANVQLMPDPTIASAETGTRHRTAERVAKQTGALVISISQARDTVSLYVGDIALPARARSPTCWPRPTRRSRRWRRTAAASSRSPSRLTALEFQNAVTLDDVLVVVQRAEMATRMGEEIERNVIELGREGWLIEMQLGELMRDIPRDRVNVIRDYEVGGDDGRQRQGAAPPGGAARTTGCSTSRSSPTASGTAA